MWCPRFLITSTTTRRKKKHRFEQVFQQFSENLRIIWKIVGYMENSDLRDFFLKFCSKDEIRPVLQEPFIQKVHCQDAVCATDAHVLLVKRIWDGKEVTVAQSDTPKIEPVIPTEECNHRFDPNKLNDALSKVPTVPYKTIECEYCGGSGVVGWYYKDKDGEEFIKDFDCPHCDGEGEYKVSGVSYKPFWFVNIGDVIISTRYAELLKTAVGQLGDFAYVAIPEKHILKLENKDYIMVFMGVWMDTMSYDPEQVVKMEE